MSLSPVWLFVVGWVGLSGTVFGVAAVCRARGVRDPLGPGTRGARRAGCACSVWRNWFGWREAFTDSSVLARRCPVIAHHPDVRRRMYSSGI